MDWNSDEIRTAFSNAGYQVVWNDLINLDSDGNLTYTVHLQRLPVTEKTGES